MFGALGMFPCGFYDLRDAAPAPVPVVSTAFRPLDRDELAANPFRVFTSMLVPEDRRFFDRGPRAAGCRRFLAARELFPAELLGAGRRRRSSTGSSRRPTQTASWSWPPRRSRCPPDPVDRAWYTELERVSGVAADIGGVTSTHINHLTPRVLDIDDLYASMQARGIEMIDEIQGPPRWDGPDVLLRQTSFRALAEPRTFRDADGEVSAGTLRVAVRRGRGPGHRAHPGGSGAFRRARRRASTAASPRTRTSSAPTWHRRCGARGCPPRSATSAWKDSGFFTYRGRPGRAAGRPSQEQVAALERGDPSALVRAGVLHPEPIVYEDFLPRSAAGIFASNLTDGGTVDADQGGAERDADWMSDVMGRQVNVPEEIYAQESSASLRGAELALGRR